MKRKQKSMKTAYRVFLWGSLTTGFILALVFFYGLGAFDDFVTQTAPPTQIVQQFNPDITQIPRTSVAITPDNTPSSTLFHGLLANVNALRRAQGLSTLTIDSRLNQAAAVQAQYNADNYEVTHQGEFGRGVATRVEAHGYLWSTVGENLLSNWDIDADNVYQLWADSPSHYENFVNPAFTQIGMAYVVTPIGQVYHAMVLAHPR